MDRNNKPATIYSRGTFKIEGSTDADRECMKLDNKRYWKYKMLIGTVALIAALTGLIKALSPLIK